MDELELQAEIATSLEEVSSGPVRLKRVSNVLRELLREVFCCCLWLAQVFGGRHVQLVAANLQSCLSRCD